MGTQLIQEVSNSKLPGSRDSTSQVRREAQAAVRNSEEVCVQLQHRRITSTATATDSWRLLHSVAVFDMNNALSLAMHMFTTCTATTRLPHLQGDVLLESRLAQAQAPVQRHADLLAVRGKRQPHDHALSACTHAPQQAPGVSATPVLLSDGGLTVTLLIQQRNTSASSAECASKLAQEWHAASKRHCFICGVFVVAC